MNRQPGGLTLAIHDSSIGVTVTGGASFELPLGPLTLLDGPLERVDPPSATHLSNALGMVQDHFDDIVIEAPTVAATPSVVAVGDHAVALAHVEIGHHSVPADYRLRRSDADELFRTLVSEPIALRKFNPGLDDEFVASIIGTCCVILGIMRRLDLHEIAIEAEPEVGGQ